MLGIVGLSACSLVTAGALPALPTVTFNDDTGVITFENGNTCHQGQFLGSGAYGTVYVVDGLPPDAPPMVVKWQINKDAYVAWDTDFLNELRIHLLLQCSELSRRPLLCVPEIVFAGTVANRPGVGLTIMHHGGITLEDYMGRHKKRPSMALNILIHLCSVFATLQEHFAFVHRDLKPNNILVRICEDDPSKDEPVLIDFGTSRLKIPSCECTKPKGQGRGGGVQAVLRFGRGVFRGEHEDVSEGGLPAGEPLPGFGIAPPLHCVAGCGLSIWSAEICGPDDPVQNVP